jgi:hypothetical protein
MGEADVRPEPTARPHGKSCEQSDAKLILWSNPERGTFFLVPDDCGLAAGSFVLRTITGREQRVDESTLAEFEVTEEQAKEWVKSEFGKILDTARGAVYRFVEKLRGGPGKPNRIADLCELLDRVEALVDLMITETGYGEVAAGDVDSLADRLDTIEARLRQLAEGFRAARLTDHLSEYSE